MYVSSREGLPPPPSYNRTTLSSETKNKAPLALALDSVRTILPSFFIRQRDMVTLVHGRVRWLASRLMEGYLLGVS